MSTLTITRGLPASGKSTFAKLWVNDAPSRRIRVNRDDLRYGLYGQYAGLSHEQEEGVTTAENAIVTASLKSGKDVIVDAMHLRSQYVKRWAQVAAKHGAEFEVRDFPVNVAEAVRRNFTRMAEGERGVPQGVIEDLAKRFQIPWEGTLPKLTDLDHGTVGHSYIPGSILAYSFDIDGTLALMCDRSPYDPSRYHLDTPNHPIVSTFHLIEDALTSYYGSDKRGKTWALIGLSGRNEDYRDATNAWLKRHDIHFDALYMRKSGDNRNDGIVKQELVAEYISGVYDVAVHFDDRQRVVDALREIGFTVAQVAPGDF